MSKLAKGPLELDPGLLETLASREVANLYGTSILLLASPSLYLLRQKRERMNVYCYCTHLIEAQA
jgi:hypothetical protein